MLNHARRYLVGSVFAVALLVPAGMLAPSAMATQPAVPHRVSYNDAVPGLAPAGTPTTGVAHGGAEQGASAPMSLICTPETGVDNPHLSSTPGVISGHGWWNKGDCDSNKATVESCLYEYYTDGTWRRKACNKKTGLFPGGGGSANRAAANRSCDSGALISWRNHVDVDVEGVWDTDEVPFRQVDVACVIAGPDQ